MTRRSRGGSSRRAASSRTGSASAATWSGRSWVPWASTWRGPGRWSPRPGPGRSRSGGRGTAPGRSAHSWRRCRRSCAAGARSQPAVEPAWTPCSAPAAPRASTAARVRQPLAFEAVGQPSQHLDLSARAASPSRSEVLGGQPVERRRQRRQPVRPAARMCVRVHGGNLSTPPPNTSTNTENVDNPAVTDFTRASKGSTAGVDSRRQPAWSATLLTRPSARTRVVVAYPPGRGQPRAWRVHGARHRATLPAPDPPLPTHPATHPTGPDGPGKAHPTPTLLPTAGWSGRPWDPGQRAARTSILPSVTRVW